jgi:hypothetical protein
MQEIDDLLVGALMPDDEEAAEGERERIIQAESPRFLGRNLLQVNQHFRTCLLNQIASRIVS